MSDYIIREATEADAEAFLNYVKRIGEESDNLTFGAEGLPFSIEAEKEYLGNIRQDKKSVIYCIFKDGELVGDGSLNVFPRRMAHRAELCISVVKDEWNNGLGSALMEKLIFFAKTVGIEIINLDVRSDNERAIYLYKKYGFKKCGTIPASLKINGEYADCDSMYLDLR